MIWRRINRWLAEVELARVDADIAYWYVDDGQLSLAPLNGPLSAWGRELRDRRLAAAARLAAAGGKDPAPSFLEPPSEAQRIARLQRAARPT